MSDLLDVPLGGGLYAAALDWVPAAEAESRLQALEVRCPDVAWMSVTGLDRSCPAVGFRCFDDLSRPPQPVPRELAAGIRETLYRPITERRRAK